MQGTWKTKKRHIQKDKFDQIVKSKKVAQFFKDREKNLDKMILENSSDAYVKSSLQTVVENLKKEVNEVLYGNVPKSDFSI